MAFLSSLYYSV